MGSSSTINHASVIIAKAYIRNFVRVSNNRIL